ncbi:MAG: bifunctional DNA-formamidopyrimidine glycosylase/DNA-(apurinic or apyrimidinic site) lyase [Steroidobacteraceae bacterium]
MPELPEVETTRRGIEPHVKGRRIVAADVHEHRLRWPVARTLAGKVQGQRVLAVERRAKYLLLRLEHGTLMLHLGMSGSLRVLPKTTPRITHDHVDLVLDDGKLLRFNDPRRFGSLKLIEGELDEEPLLKHLAPEPLEPGFDGEYLFRITRKRRVAIKLLIMNGRLVTGVGNIYASEALFRAGIRPKRAAKGLKRVECDRLAAAIRAVLESAIGFGGTTLRDYVSADGSPGYFRRELFVYERADEPCRVCSTPIKHFTQGQRSTYYCPTCQT